MEISSIERVERTASQPASQLARDQQDVRKRSEPEGANTVPQVRESGAATKHAEARTERAPGGTTPKARLPILLG